MANKTNVSRVRNIRYFKTEFSFNYTGQMHYFVNKEHKGILLSHLPTNKNLWALFDIYGNTVSATFVPPGKKFRTLNILEKLLFSGI